MRGMEGVKWEFEYALDMLDKCQLFVSSIKIMSPKNDLVSSDYK